MLNNCTFSASGKNMEDLLKPMAFVLSIFFLVFLLVIIVCVLGIGYRRGRNHLMETFCPARLAREKAQPKRRFRPLGEKFNGIEADPSYYSLHYPRLFKSTHISGGFASLKYQLVATPQQQQQQLACRTQLVGGAYASAVYPGRRPPVARRAGGCFGSGGSKESDSFETGSVPQFSVGTASTQTSTSRSSGKPNVLTLECID